MVRGAQVNFEKEVTLKRCIGSGGFSNVYHGLWQVPCLTPTQPWRAR
jgi:hypothetical protein